MKRHTSKALLFSVLIFALTSLSTAASNKPNVLMILVDDLKPAIGAYGDTYAKTPNLDRLANMGIRFNMAYCNQAVCMASRYNLLLGARSTSTGLYNFGSQFRDVYPDAVTLPQHFMNAGYHVESMGKIFHIGHGNDNDDASWSIPHHKDKVIEYVLSESTQGGRLTREEALFTNDVRKSGVPVRERVRGAAWENPDVTDESYADGRVATHAIDRLRELAKNPEQPFFMALGFVRPHLPFSAPKKYWDMHDRFNLPMPEFTDAPEGAPAYAVKRGGEINAFFPVPSATDNFDEDLIRSLIHGYYASTSYMDAQLGRVLDQVKALGLDKNTIIMLWGDHGWHLGDHSSWTKHSNYEQANRIPIMFVAPGVTKPNTATDQLAETVDIYPTLADLAGLPAPKGPQPIDGTSLVPVLKNPDKRVKDHIYHSFPKRGKLGCAIRTDQYRLVAWKPTTGKGKTEYELYDYLNDPLEKKNIASENPEIVRELNKKLSQHPDPLPQRKKK